MFSVSVTTKTITSHNPLVNKNDVSANRERADKTLQSNPPNLSFESQTLHANNDDSGILNEHDDSMNEIEVLTDSMKTHTIHMNPSSVSEPLLIDSFQYPVTRVKKYKLLTPEVTHRSYSRRENADGDVIYDRLPVMMNIRHRAYHDQDSDTADRPTASSTLYDVTKQGVTTSFETDLTALNQ